MLHKGGVTVWCVTKIAGISLYLYHLKGGPITNPFLSSAYNELQQSKSDAHPFTWNDANVFL